MWAVPDGEGLLGHGFAGGGARAAQQPDLHSHNGTGQGHLGGCPGRGGEHPVCQELGAGIQQHGAVGKAEAVVNASRAGGLDADLVGGAEVHGSCVAVLQILHARLVS